MAGKNIVKALHTGISVNNMQESIEWYDRILGFKVCRDDGYIPPLGAKIVFLEKDGYQIELFEYDNPKPLPEDRLTPNSDLQTIGTKHVAFQVDDMEDMLADLKTNNVEIAHTAVMNGEAVTFIRDCNGVLIELIQPPEMPPVS